jgi:hypothetical protein
MKWLYEPPPSICELGVSIHNWGGESHLFII